MRLKKTNKEITKKGETRQSPKTKTSTIYNCCLERMRGDRRELRHGKHGSRKERGFFAQ